MHWMSIDLFLLRILFHGCLFVLYPLILVYLIVGQQGFDMTVSGTILSAIFSAIAIALQLLL